MKEWERSRIVKKASPNANASFVVVIFSYLLDKKCGLSCSLFQWIGIADPLFFCRLSNPLLYERQVIERKVREIFFSRNRTIHNDGRPAWMPIIMITIIMTLIFVWGVDSIHSTFILHVFIFHHFHQLYPALRILLVLPNGPRGISRRSGSISTECIGNCSWIATF